MFKKKREKPVPKQVTVLVDSKPQYKTATSAGYFKNEENN